MTDLQQESIAPKNSIFNSVWLVASSNPVIPEGTIC